MVAGLTLFVLFTMVLQLAGSGLVIWRMRNLRPLPQSTDHPAITVIRPVCGADPDLAETLATTFTGNPASCDIIFCVARADDPAVPITQQVIAAHPAFTARLLIGEDAVSGNPKLNNVVKGWAAARHDWIALIDSNVLLPADYIRTLFATWRDDTGLVTSPPVGIRADGFWARVEAGFLNTYQDRLQLMVDQLGQGFAQGKVLFWRREILDAAGGLAALGRDLAEDVAATKVVRAAGLRVRVVLQPFAQPLGHRNFAEVWSRQVRWARVRRDGFPHLFALEPMSGVFPPLLALTGLVTIGAVSPVILPVFLAVWYGAEVWLARAAGWPSAASDVVAWVLRDLLIAPVWIASWARRGFVWRGNAMVPTATTGPTAAPQHQTRPLEHPAE